MSSLLQGILKSLEHLMNSELAKVKKWCDINKLSINMGKTNFMIIKSARKRDMEISLNISNSDGSSHALERKQCIKYLGVMIDGIFNLEVSHRIYLFSYISKYRNSYLN